MEFECPDAAVVRLLELAVRYPAASSSFDDRVSSYAEVIETASRPMDEVPLALACRNYARLAYMAANPEIGKSLSFLLVPPQAAVDSILTDNPILQACPRHTLYSSYLPVRRPLYEPPAEAVRQSVTGWVDLTVDISDSGAVEQATIVASSDPILETGISDYVRQFRYPSAMDPTHADMPRKEISLRVPTDYFDIARAKGCVWHDPRQQPSSK